MTENRAGKQEVNASCITDNTGENRHLVIWQNAFADFQPEGSRISHAISRFLGMCIQGESQTLNLLRGAAEDGHVLQKCWVQKETLETLSQPHSFLLLNALVRCISPTHFFPGS